MSSCQKIISKRLNSRARDEDDRRSTSSRYRVSNVCLVRGYEERNGGSSNEVEERRMRFATGISNVHISVLSFDGCANTSRTGSRSFADGEQAAAADCSRKSLPKANSNQRRP